MTTSASNSERFPVLDPNRISYSDRLTDDVYEYRHVILPKEFGKYIPKTHLLSESEWRNLGIQQSPGWEHYMIHNPEPHILMFRRPLAPGANAENENPMGVCNRAVTEMRG